MNKIKQFLCGLFTNHCFLGDDTKLKWNRETDEYTITETCKRCGKNYSFTTPAKKFGL